MVQDVSFNRLTVLWGDVFSWFLTACRGASGSAPTGVGLIPRRIWSSKQYGLTYRSPVSKIIKIPIAPLNSTPIYNKGH